MQSHAKRLKAYFFYYFQKATKNCQNSTKKLRSSLKIYGKPRLLAMLMELITCSLLSQVCCWQPLEEKDKRKKGRKCSLVIYISSWTMSFVRTLKAGLKLMDVMTINTQHTHTHTEPPTRIHYAIKHSHQHT